MVCASPYLSVFLVTKPTFVGCSFKPHEILQLREFLSFLKIILLKMTLPAWVPEYSDATWLWADMEIAKATKTMIGREGAPQNGNV